MAQEEITVDVLVVGTGASGMATAVTAASQGLEVKNTCVQFDMPAVFSDHHATKGDNS
jgi:succinate dehydrogenase/fumarate reductase flavoprotein subunit